MNYQFKKSMILRVLTRPFGGFNFWPLLPNLQRPIWPVLSGEGRPGVDMSWVLISDIKGSPHTTCIQL